MMRSVAGALSGGLFNVRLSGSGIIAITSHYEPLTLPVGGAHGEVFTDPNATVAWADGVKVDIATDVSLGTLFGRTSGESIQMKFSGNGWVVVQPYEEKPMRWRMGELVSTRPKLSTIEAPWRVA